ncbi:MAG: hypothetical protein ACRDPF_27855 [Streptosporangiaceae bacterium]
MTRGGGFAAAGRAVPQQRPACWELASPGTVFAFHAVIRTRFPGAYTLAAGLDIDLPVVPARWCRAQQK